MAIIANIVKRDERKVENKKEQANPKPVLSLEAIHKMYAKSNQVKEPISSTKKTSIPDKLQRITSYQDTNQINIKKTSRYLEDLTIKGD